MNLSHSICLKPLPKELPGFNVEAAVARMFDDPELWWRSLAIFHKYYWGWEASWVKAQSSCERERSCVHALRSSAANVGADRLAAAAATLEKELSRMGTTQDVLLDLREQLQACFIEVRLSTATALGGAPESTIP